MISKLIDSGVFHNRDGVFITEWFRWFPFLGIFGTPMVAGFIEGGIFGALLFGAPFMLMLLMQKFFPI